MRFGCFTLMILLAIMLCFTGCQTKEETPDVISLTEPFGEEWSLEMTVENVTPTGATVVFNHSGDGVGLMTGEPYTLDRWENGEWIQMSPSEELCFNAIGYLIPNNSSYTLDVNWEYGHGALPSGRYRVGKSVSIEGVRSGEYEGVEKVENYIEDTVYYAEFEIE